MVDLRRSQEAGRLGPGFHDTWFWTTCRSATRLGASVAQRRTVARHAPRHSAERDKGRRQARGRARQPALSQSRARSSARGEHGAPRRHGRRPPVGGSDRERRAPGLRSEHATPRVHGTPGGHQPGRRSPCSVPISQVVEVAPGDRRGSPRSRAWGSRSVPRRSLRPDGARLPALGTFCHGCDGPGPTGLSEAVPAGGRHGRRPSGDCCPDLGLDDSECLLEVALEHGVVLAHREVADVLHLDEFAALDLLGRGLGHSGVVR